MNEQIPVLAALEAIHAQGHGSFVVVTADAGRNLYAQFATSEEVPGIYAEIVGDTYLAAEDHVAAAQQNEMRARG